MQENDRYRQLYQIGDEVRIVAHPNREPNSIGWYWIQEVDDYANCIGKVTDIKRCEEEYAYRLCINGKDINFTFVCDWLELAEKLHNKYIVMLNNGSFYVVGNGKLISPFGESIPVEDFSSKSFDNANDNELSIKNIWSRAKGNNAFSPDRESIVFQR